VYYSAGQKWPSKGREFCVDLKINFQKLWLFQKVYVSLLLSQIIQKQSALLLGASRDSFYILAHLYTHHYKTLNTNTWGSICIIQCVVNILRESAYQQIRKQAHSLAPVGGRIFALNVIRCCCEFFSCSLSLILVQRILGL